MEKFEEILKCMGYRTLRPGIWAKPVAFHLFMFEMDKMLWTNFFKGTNDALLVWNSETYKEAEWIVDEKPNFLLFLKYTEQNTRIDTTNTNADFEFLTTEEIWQTDL